MNKKPGYEVEFVHIQTGTIVRVWFDQDGDVRPYSGFTDEFSFEEYWPEIQRAVSGQSSSQFRALPAESTPVDIYAANYREVDMVRLGEDPCSLKVGFVDEGEDAFAPRYRLHAVTLFDDRGKVLFTNVYKNLLPNDQLGREVQDRLNGRPSPFKLGSLRRY